MQKIVRTLLGLLLVAAPAFELNNINVSAMRRGSVVRLSKTEEADESEKIVELNLDQDWDEWIERYQPRILEREMDHEDRQKQSNKLARKQKDRRLTEDINDSRDSHDNEYLG